MEVTEQQITLRRLVPSNGKVLVKKTEHAREQAREMLANGDGTYSPFVAVRSKEMYLGCGDEADNYTEIDE